MTDPNPNESRTIGQSIAHFMAALHTLGAASATWKNRQTEQTAAAMDNACGAVETALAMVVLSVGEGLGQTRSEIEAWRERRRLMMPQTIGRIVLPSDGGK